jgi:RNA polymerase sigma-70 factor (ECF subfamily)
MSDAATVTQQIVRHRHAVVAFLYGIVPDYHSVEDMFQEICVVAIQKAAEFQEGTNFVGWVRAIARNKVREHLRRRGGVLLDDAFFDGFELAFDGARSAVDVDQRKEALRLCLDELQKGARQILSLRYDEGLTPAGIADRTGRSRVAVNSLLQRIRETLKECVERRSAAVRA